MNQIVVPIHLFPNGVADINNNPGEVFTLAELRAKTNNNGRSYNTTFMKKLCKDCLLPAPNYYNRCLMFFTDYVRPHINANTQHELENTPIGYNRQD